MADPPAGKAGWFYVDDLQRAEAALLTNGLCIAAKGGRTWSIKPDETIATTWEEKTPCDGTAPNGEWAFPGATVTKVFAVGEQRVYQVDGSFVLEGDGPRGLRKLPAPPGWVRDTEVAGENLFVVLEPELNAKRKVTEGPTLYRLVGEAWEPVRVGAGSVTSVLGAPNGQAFAVTTKNELHESKDGGMTWTPYPLPEKRLTLGHLSRSDVSPTRETLRVSVERFGSEESLELRLPEVSRTSFSAATFRTTPPEGVTSIDGIPLTRANPAIEALTALQECSIRATSGAVTVAACQGRSQGELVLRQTDDDGASVREIFRAPVAYPLAAMAMTDTEVVLGFTCGRELGTDECRQNQALSLRRTTGDRWESAPIDLRGQREVLSVSTDRSTAGGFIFRVGPARAKDNPSPGAVVHVSGRAVEMLDLAGLLTSAASGEAAVTGVVSTTVHQDGSLGLIFAHRNGSARSMSYARATLGGAVIERRTLASEALARIPEARIVLVDKRVIALDVMNRTMIVSEDAGANFFSYKVIPMATYPMIHQIGYATATRMACGVAGCDFINPGSATRLAWRWGDKPMTESLSSAGLVAN